MRNNRSGLNSTMREMPVEGIGKIINLFRPQGLKKLHLFGLESQRCTRNLIEFSILRIHIRRLFFPLLSTVPAQGKSSSGIPTRGKRASVDQPRCFLRGGQRPDPRGGNFKKVISLRERNKIFEVTPRLKMVVSQNNAEDVEDFCELAFSLGFTPEFAFIRRSGNAEAEWAGKALSAMQKQRILKLLARINRERGADIFLPSCTVTCPLTEGPKELGLCIKTNGDIQPCQALYGKEFAAGNLYHFDMPAFTARVGEICALAAKRKEQDFGCARCILSGACGKGCMAEAADLTGDPLGDDGNCEGRKQQFIARTLAKNEESIASSN